LPILSSNFCRGAGTSLPGEGQEKRTFPDFRRKSARAQFQLPSDQQSWLAIQTLRTRSHGRPKPIWLRNGKALEKDAIAGVNNLSRRPKSGPNQTDPAIEKIVVQENKRTNL